MLQPENMHFQSPVSQAASELNSRQIPFPATVRFPLLLYIHAKVSRLPGQCRCLELPTLAEPQQRGMCQQHCTRVPWSSMLVSFWVSNDIPGPDFCLFHCNPCGCLHEGEGYEKSYQIRTGIKTEKSSMQLQLDALPAPGCVQACLLASEAADHLVVI